MRKGATRALLEHFLRHQGRKVVWPNIEPLRALSPLDNFNYLQHHNETYNWKTCCSGSQELRRPCFEQGGQAGSRTLRMSPRSLFLPLWTTAGARYSCSRETLGSIANRLAACRFFSPSCLVPSVWQASTSVTSTHYTCSFKDPIDLDIGRKPTSATSEAKVNVAAGGMPWQTEGSKGDEAREHYKYRTSAEGPTSHFFPRSTTI